VRVVVHRTPFFQIDGVWFADVLWNYGHPLEVDPELMVRLLVRAPGSFVLGRRLGVRQEQALVERRWDFENEAFASIFPRDSDRWG
jgi:hypothetical protein